MALLPAPGLPATPFRTPVVAPSGQCAALIHSSAPTRRPGARLGVSRRIRSRDSRWMVHSRRTSAADRYVLVALSDVRYAKSDLNLLRLPPRGGASGGGTSAAIRRARRPGRPAAAPRPIRGLHPRRGRRDRPRLVPAPAALARSSPRRAAARRVGALERRDVDRAAGVLTVRRTVSTARSSSSARRARAVARSRSRGALAALERSRPGSTHRSSSPRRRPAPHPTTSAAAGSGRPASKRPASRTARICDLRSTFAWTARRRCHRVRARPRHGH